MQAVYIRSDIHCILVVHLVASDNQTGFSKKNILPYQFLKFCYKFYYLNHFKMYSSGASLVAQMVKKKKKKKSACNVGDEGSVPGLGRSPGEGNGYLLQYSCLKSSIDRGV